MKHFIICALTALSIAAPLPLLAQEVVADDVLIIMPADDVVLADFQWEARVITVFADSPRDPAFARQIELLSERPDTLVERDVIVLTDTDPAAKSDVRTQLRPRGFALVIVDKDGRVMLRKPDPWDVREISRAIDKTTLRQQEIKEEKEAARAASGTQG